MKTVCIIPARMGSSRFPGKPLAPLLGRPMLQHVYGRVRLSEDAGDVYVATCDAEIRDAVEAFGGSVIMTSSSHVRASERVAEAVEGLDADLVVMVQGDEPLVRPEMISTTVRAFRDDPSIECTNLGGRILFPEEFEDPNTIKVVVDLRSDALFFSREPVPTTSRLGFGSIRALKQVCIIGFTKQLLETYVRLDPTPLEEAESIDMLRLLEHGRTVRIIPTDWDSHAVDTPEDLRTVEALLRADPLLPAYF